MLKEALVVFKKMLEKKGEALIVDNYIPADGTYVLVNDKGTIEHIAEIKLDKKTQKVENKSIKFKEIASFDYHSKLLSMNKPIDGKKIIHSNNYLSFAVKKDNLKNGKLMQAIIDNYYNVLADPLQMKYKKSKEATAIYKSFVKENGDVDKIKLEFCKSWIKEHIFCINDSIQESEKIDMGKKDYLKIFFIFDESVYELENNRYILPNIYNSNEYNVEINGEIFGLPDDNMGMNAKKPFLANKSRKCPVPYLLNGEDVLLQRKFFEYLMNLASIRECNVYIDTDKNDIRGYKDGESVENIESGYYLRIKKGKELEIQVQDNVTDYKKKLDRPFVFKSIFEEPYKFHKEYNDFYKAYSDRFEVGRLIDTILFFNYLKNNYYTDAGDLKTIDNVSDEDLLTYRNSIFDWVYKGRESGFLDAMKKCSMNIIKHSILSGIKERAIWQVDFYYALINYFKGEDHMAEIIKDLRATMKAKIFAKEPVSFSNDDEYFYGIGQLAYYLLSLSKAANKTQSMINPFLNARTDNLVKRRLKQLYMKYNYDMNLKNLRVKNLITMIWGYKAAKIDQDMIILGFVDNNLIFTKAEEAADDADSEENNK